MPDRVAAYLIVLMLALSAFAVFLQSHSLETYRGDIKHNYDYCYASEKAAEHQDSKDCQSFLYKATDDPVALFTGGLFAFTIALAIATVRLFQVTKKGLADQEALTRASLLHADRSAKAAEEAIQAANISSERQLRAYVHMAKASFDNILNVAEFTIEFTNFGQTPARTVEAFSVLAYTDFPPPQDAFDNEEVWARLGEMGPSDSVHVRRKGPRQLTMDEVTGLSNGSGAIYVVGALRYVDVFRVQRTTRFKVMIGGTGGILDSGLMYNCSDGNDSD